MEALPNGARYVNVSLNVTVTLASNVGWKATRLTI